MLHDVGMVKFSQERLASIALGTFPLLGARGSHKLLWGALVCRPGIPKIDRASSFASTSSACGGLEASFGSEEIRVVAQARVT